MFRKLTLLCVAVALSGCWSQSQIQAKYSKSQNLCRVESAKVLVEGEGNAAIGKAFSECMNGAGWHVASPKTGVATNNPPSGSPSTNPIASAAKPVAPQPAAAVKAPVAPVAEPTAIYQPARPINTPAPNYGTGGGRNF